MKKVKFSTTLNENLIKDLKIKAIEENQNVNEILGNLIQNYLGGNDMKNLKELLLQEGELMESYYNKPADDYDLVFWTKYNKYIVRNVKLDDEAKINEDYLDNEEVIKEILENLEIEQIEEL